MKQEVRLLEERGNLLHVVADQVLHHAIGVALRRTERQAGDCSDMLLELRYRAGGLGPMARIVDTRREFVGQKPAVLRHEELDADHADIVERFEKLERRLAGLPGDRRTSTRGNGRVPQYAVAVDV